ncbi:methylmalonyl-CoA/ethylmalonyl-CoA epimerase [Lachnospiraceae bacterium]|nr:methylmalonyl-CoA/ethylmalonyl-CoA epimerase [Lachnospiraceae bacterium]
MSLKIHHIGYMIKKIERSLPQFTALGYEVEIPEFSDESRKCDFCFLVKDGYRVELISPWGDDSPLFPMLKHHKNMMYHICYETDSMEQEIERLTEMHYALVEPPAKAPAISDTAAVAFLMHKDLGMIELVKN